MPAAFESAAVIVSRAGAGAVAELAAAGKPSILVPFPFAADDHQLRNAEAFERAGAAQLILDREMNGDRLVKAVIEVYAQLEPMATAARGLARPGATRRIAGLLEELIDSEA
jgi:UDP-N-acetylglucosamine--N-acetylmuramyl-(pentapeptide) pyrophosphoryl-undecaprenol N-acetylglucosamine transferase